MGIITDLMKTTLSGAIDKFDHSYKTLLDSIIHEKEEDIKYSKKINEFDIEINELR
jgi:hypothetical protein